MDTFKSIVVATDFGEASEAAVARGVQLAQASHAALTLVHVFAVPAVTGYGMYVPIDTFTPVERAAQAKLDSVLAGVRGPLPRAEAVLRVGAPWQEILDVARDRSADLVVVGTHGRSGVARALLGSVAEKVVRLAPSPVLTVHGPAESLASPFRHILVATDFGEASDAAVARAIELALTSDATLTLVHAFDMPTLTAYGAYSARELFTPVEQAARRTFDEALARAQRRLPRARGDFRIGNPAVEIVDGAREPAADLIVVGTHGRRGLAHVLIGSVAEKVVRLSTVPVLSVRGPAGVPSAVAA